MFALTSTLPEQSDVHSWLNTSLIRHGLDAVLGAQTPESREVVWRQLAYQPVAVSQSMLDYQREYLNGVDKPVFDLTLVLKSDGTPVGLLPLTLSRARAWRLSSMGAAISAPLFAKTLSPRTEKKLCSRLLSVLQNLATDVGQNSLIAEQGCRPNELQACSEWQQQWMAAGATNQTRYDLFTDLGPDFSTIRSAFRKSYRPLINVAFKTWHVSVMDAGNANADTWTAFKQLHKDVAGRSTRTDATWELQWQMLLASEAFLVTLRDTADQRLVGAGLFQYTRDEGLYAVGAYDRTLFDKPLGHAVQQRAIETLKDLGVRWYMVGERHYRQSPYNPSPKEVSIGEFKQGFSSHLFCRHQFMLEVRQGDGC